MSVDELAQIYGLDIVFDRLSNGWLQVATIGGATLEKLAALARMNAADLDALQRPLTAQAPASAAAAESQGSQRHLAYCPICVFLNPLDVTSPCWKREWMDPTVTSCPLHARQLQKLSQTSLRMCGNFDHVLRVISRREARLHALRSRSIYPR